MDPTSRSAMYLGLGNPVNAGSALSGAARDIGLPRALGNLEHVTEEIQATTKALVERLARCVLPPVSINVKEAPGSEGGRSPGCQYAEEAEVIVARLLGVVHDLQALLRNLDV